MLTMIGELVALPSISCVNPQFDQSNLAVIERLAEWCESLSFHTEILPLPNAAKKFNLVATLGQGAQGLVLAGHTDTVPYDVEQWQSDPFQLTPVGNRLYGLGTTDMKAFLALALTAASQFEARHLQQPLILLATADEESGMGGAQALGGQLRAGQAVIGEPTSLRPVRMHKGIFMESIHLQGISGHSSNPALGNSALEGMYQVIGELLKWRGELQANYVNPLFKVPVPTLNLGSIQGGDNPNRICGNCELYIDVRLLPGMAIEELRAVLHQRVREVVQGTGLSVEFKPLFAGVAPLETPAQTEIVQVVERLTHCPAEAVAFCTEAPYLQKLGIETVILGPGDVEQAHQPNEFIRFDRLQPTVAILTQLIQHFCVRGTLD